LNFKHTPTNREFTKIADVTDADGTPAMLCTHQYTNAYGRKCVSRMKVYDFMRQPLQIVDRHGNITTIPAEIQEVSN
jgi:hypothetical protein